MKRCYRTEVWICVGCKKEIRFRFEVTPRLAGYFRSAINARHCPRCSTIKLCADNNGDEICKKYVEKHMVAYS
jgi:hypothetical protein